MKDLKDYILERGPIHGKDWKDSQVWVVSDKDLDGAILDVCETEEDAKKAYDEHMKENKDSHLEIKPCKRSEVEKENIW